LRTILIALVLASLFGCSTVDPLEVRLLKEEIEKHQTILSGVNGAKLETQINGVDSDCDSARAIIRMYDSLQSLLSNYYLPDPRQLCFYPKDCPPRFRRFLKKTAFGVYFDTIDVKHLMHLDWYPKNEWVQLVPIELYTVSSQQATDAFDSAIEKLLRDTRDLKEFVNASSTVAFYERRESTIRRESAILKYLRDSLAAME